MIRILISGALGNMGRSLYDLIKQEEDMQVAAGIDPRAAGETQPFPLYALPDSDLPEADVLVDFSIAQALPGLLDFALERELPLVLAATGYAPEHIRLIDQAAVRIPIFRSANMSYGMNLVCELAAMAAGSLGDGFDAEIVERHHRRKIDAPSGSAYMLADALNAAYPAEKKIVLDRPARREPRSRQEIGIVSVRGGTVVGDHQVGFYGDDEIVELRHTALSRRIFAAGALRAARFIAAQAPGLYNMQQLLLSQSLITQVSVQRDVAMMSISGYPFSAAKLSLLFSAIRTINIDMISQTAPDGGKVDISFSLGDDQIEKALDALRKVASPTRITQHMVKLTVEGLGMAHASGVASRLFDLLARTKVRAYLITTSETKISLLIAAPDERRAVNALKKEFSL